MSYMSDTAVIIPLAPVSPPEDTGTFSIPTLPWTIRSQRVGILLAVSKAMRKRFLHKKPRQAGSRSVEGTHKWQPSKKLRCSSGVASWWKLLFWFLWGNGPTVSGRRCTWLGMPLTWQSASAAVPHVRMTSGSCCSQHGRAHRPGRARCGQLWPRKVI